MCVVNAKIRGPTPAQATKVIKIIPIDNGGRVLT